MPIKLNPIQAEARELALSPAKIILFRGGTGSGKTFGIIDLILDRATIAPGSRHAIFRSTAVEARATIFEQTLKEVIEAKWPVSDGSSSWALMRDQGMINKETMTITLDNGSTILIGGLDDNNRLERVLGSDYLTCYINEASQLDSFRPVQLLRTRLRQKINNKITGDQVAPKLFIDCNPPSKRHWTFIAFCPYEYPGGPERIRLNPLTGKPHAKPDQWAQIKMDAIHNSDNLSDGYLDDVAEGDHKHVAQFVDGEWHDDVENAMFSGDDIAKTRLPAILPHDCPGAECEACGGRLASFTRIEIGVDPATTAHEKSDETGIVVLGRDAENHAYVLDDLSGRYTPPEWGEKVCHAFRQWKADAVVAERNQGGLMVVSTMRTVDPFIPVKTIHESNGKEIRAEGTATAYRQRRVHHCGSFPKLEGQLLDFETGFDRKRKGSPDRLDALVHGLNSILLMKVRDRSGKQQVVKSFWH